MPRTVSLQSDGSLWAWGGNAFGQLGDDSTTDRLSPAHIGTATDWVVGGGGGYHSLALRGPGTLWSWGYNSNSQLGDDSSADSHVPKQVGVDTGWTAVSGGSGHSMALRSDGTLWTWGCNTSGQLGDGLLTNRLVPTQIGTERAGSPSAPAGSTHSPCRATARSGPGATTAMANWATARPRGVRPPPGSAPIRTGSRSVRALPSPWP